MTHRPQRGRLLVACAAAVLLAACAQTPHPNAPRSANHWSGRLAVVVEGESSRSFQAGFELTGTAEAGTLTLFSPLGSTVAQLQWQAQQATLRYNDTTHQSPSLDALVHEVTGSALPIAALFSWLHGDAVQASGWSVDLDRLTQGRITATRTTPEPRTTLRIALD